MTKIIFWFSLAMILAAFLVIELPVFIDFIVLYGKGIQP